MSSPPTTAAPGPALWIVHREPRWRTAIARLAGAPEDALLGAPSDPAFASAPPPDVVLLGLAGDFEAELQFVHRVRARLRDAKWILLADAGRVATAGGLFDTLDAEILAWPPEARRVRDLLAEPRGRDLPLPLSQRPGRDALAARFERWFPDPVAPELLRALDPRLADVPLLVTGEAGCGRGLLARYVQAFGGTAGGALGHVPCAGDTSAGEIAAALRSACASPRARLSLAVWLEDVDRLPEAIQRRLADWIELGLPESVRAPRGVRWLATAADPPRLAARFRHALAGLWIRLPPVRARPRGVPAFVARTAQAWCAARQQRARRFGEDALVVLEGYPWPGNWAELEAVVRQTLASCAADPVGAGDLVYDGHPFAPLTAAPIGPTHPEEEEEPRPERPAAVPPPAAEGSLSNGMLRRLARAVAHEVRNPLVPIRTYAALLPERYLDTEFRRQFATLVGEGIHRIEDVVDRLARLADLAPPQLEEVDVNELVGSLLDERRDAIHALERPVLRRLDADPPIAVADFEQLRFAFESLLNRCLDLVPELGPMSVETAWTATGLRGEPAIRARIHLGAGEAGAAGTPDVSRAENSLEFVAAEAIARANGGSMTLASDPQRLFVEILLPVV